MAQQGSSEEVGLGSLNTARPRWHSARLQESMSARGHTSHFVRMYVKAARLDVLPTADRHTLAVPLPAEAFDWLIDELRLNPSRDLPRAQASTPSSG